MRAYLLLALLICGLPLGAQSWDALRSLTPGDRVRVLDTAGKEIDGAFSAISDDAISLETGTGHTSISRPQVRRVQIHTNSRRGRNALIGAAIGLAVGVIVDQTLGRYLRNETGDSGRAITYIAPIALFGGIGAALPSYRTVYRAR